MNRFYNTVALLKEYGRFSWVAWDLVLMAVLVLYGAVTHDMVAVFISLSLFIMVAWEISDVYLFQERDKFKKALVDKCDEAVLLKGENVRLKEEVERLGVITGDRKGNPIKSNRIVSDRTFAVRLMNFAGSTQASDLAGEEELEYFRMTAERLLKWQTRTVHKDSEEYRYLERLGLMPEPSANTGDHPEEMTKKANPKKRPASRERTKPEPHGNENKD